MTNTTTTKSKSTEYIWGPKISGVLTEGRQGALLRCCRRGHPPSRWSYCHRDSFCQWRFRLINFPKNNEGSDATYRNEKTNTKVFHHLYFTVLDSAETIPKQHTNTGLGSWRWAKFKQYMYWHLLWRCSYLMMVRRGLSPIQCSLIWTLAISSCQLHALVIMFLQVLYRYFTSYNAHTSYTA